MDIRIFMSEEEIEDKYVNILYDTTDTQDEVDTNEFNVR